MKRWIWEHDEYPNFTYDLQKLQSLIEKVSKEQGYLLALTQTMNSQVINQKQLEALMNEAMSTAAIEGQILNRDSVKTSVQKKLGLLDSHYKKTDSATDNLIEILVDANTNYDEELTIERLFGWQNALFEKGYSGFHKINIASFRGKETMQIAGGGAGNEKIYYEAPPRERLEEEMQRFLTWFNTAPSSLLKASIAHLWFVVIHSFDDGNGRITRAITDRVLSHVENTRVPRLYSMSQAIENDRKGYYKALENTTGYIRKTQQHLDITLWCEWFLSTLHTALLDTKKKLDFIVQKTKFWDLYKHTDLNARQIKVLNFILDIGVENFKGNLSKRKYMSLADTASSTASRDIAELIKFGCIKQKEGTSGRNVSYEIVMKR